MLQKISATPVHLPVKIEKSLENVIEECDMLQMMWSSAQFMKVNMDSQIDHLKAQLKMAGLNFLPVTKDLTEKMDLRESDNVKARMLILSKKLCVFLRPFDRQIRSKNLRFYIAEDKLPEYFFGDLNFCMDWKVYTEIMHQLVTNAIKFSTKDGKIIIKTTVLGEGKYALFCDLVTQIADSGIGMDERKMEGLFMTFKRSLEQTQKYLL